MCHSVEMYMPRLARDAAEHRLRAADRLGAERERAMAAMTRRLWTLLSASARRAFTGSLATQPAEEVR